MKNKLLKSVYDKIRFFECEAGESFFDYFAHDRINDNSWAFFLLGKCHKEVSDRIIKEILDDNKCIDQDVLYDVKPEYIDNPKTSGGYDYIEENMEFNRFIMAEFLIGTDHYLNMFTEWYSENGYGEPSEEFCEETLEFFTKFIGD